MRELRRRDDVADRVHAVDARAHVAVDDDEAALVDLDAGAVEPDVLGARPAADRHDDLVDRRARSSPFFAVEARPRSPSKPSDAARRCAP